MDTLLKSMKSKQSSLPENQPILSDHDPNADRHEVVVKIDCCSHSYNPFESSSPASNKPWQGGGSYDTQETGGAGVSSFNPSSSEDPASQLMIKFARNSQTSGLTMSPMVDLEMSDMNKNTSRDSSSSSDEEEKDNRDDVAEVITCTSNSSFGRSKPRSRLLDQQSPHPPSPDRRSGRPPLPRSGQARSAALNKSGLVGTDEDDDDPFVDFDLPADIKKMKFSVLTILQCLSLVLIVVALGCSLVIPLLQRQRIWSLQLWKWEVMILVLICGRLVSGWFVRIAVFLIERSFLLRKRVLYFVYGVRNAVQNCLWLGLVIITWQILFDKRTSQSPVLPYVGKVLLCLLIATLLRLVKTLLLKVLASSFHVSTYFERIQESLFNQYIIETLSGPPLYEEDQTMAEVQQLKNAGAKLPNDLQEKTLPNQNKDARLSRVFSVNKNDGGSNDNITIEHLHKLNQKNISAWNMKRLIKIVRYRTLTTLDEKIRGDNLSRRDESATQILTENEAKIAARRIFINVAKPNAKYIYLTDLVRFMKEEEALKTLNLFEGSKEHKGISKRALKDWMVSAYRERRALALTLNDTNTAVNKLHQMANLVVGIIIFALWLIILQIATTQFFVFLSSQILLAAFIFGNTLKTVFESIVFLFVMHPFDVGDRCEVDGMQVVVEEMNIMTTIFMRYDNLKISYPNNVLATKPISNYYRSPDMGDSIDFAINVATPADKITKMKEKILQYMGNKRDHWYPEPMVVLRDVDDMNKLRVSIWMRQTHNFQNMGLRFERRELLLLEMIKILRELDIEYRMLPFDVNVRNLPPIDSTRLPSTWTTVN